MGRGLDAPSWVGEYQTVLPGRGEQLAHGEQDLVLHGVRELSNFLHYPLDMHRAHVPEPLSGQVRQDVYIVGVFVHGLGISPEAALVCSKPRLGPLVHGGGVPHH